MKMNKTYVGPGNGSGHKICFCAVHCVFNAYHEIACCDEPYCPCFCHVPLICDNCGGTNWNLASLNKPHGQQANPVKGYEACDGRWRTRARAGDRRGAADVIQFPKGGESR